jgi:DNA-binding HxlR family transcriptional regulator
MKPSSTQSVSVDRTRPSKSYQQYCPIAVALDLLGDRWTLLVLRELSLAGPLRFTDLRRNLRAIPPNLLSERLKSLTEDGLVSLQTLPPPAARAVYTLSEQGLEALPVLRALARFGVPRLGEVPEGGMRPVSAVRALLDLYRDPDAGAAYRYRVVVDGEAFELSPADPSGPADRSAALVTVSLPAATLVALRQDRLSVRQALAGGELTVQGPPKALAGFAAAYRLRW